jgi:hypothetical protein
MHDNSKGNKWDEQTLNGTNGDTNVYVCGFSGGAYHLTTTSSGLFCNPEAPNLVFSNVAFEAKMTILKGDMAGVGVRWNQKGASGYLFEITTQGGYVLEGINLSGNGLPYTILRQGGDASIKQGLNQINLIALVANGTTLSAYVNNQLVATAQDSTYSQGQLAVYGEGVNQASNVVASDARVWKI